MQIASSLDRAKQLMASMPGGFVSTTNTDVEILENFFPLLVLEITRDLDAFECDLGQQDCCSLHLFRNLVPYEKNPGVFNFFRGCEKEKFPNDLDTTSIAMTVMPQNDKEKVQIILDEMLKYRNDQGIFQVYFDRSRLRIDATVCANILSLFASSRRLEEPVVTPTLEYVFETLKTRAYLPNGTRYYPTPEAFLYFVGRFVERSDRYAPSAKIGVKWKAVLKKRLAERAGVLCSPLAMAMRLMLGKQLSIPILSEVTSAEVKSLLSSQSANGGWYGGWLCGYPSTGVNIQNVGLTTCFAIKALENIATDQGYAW